MLPLAAFLNNPILLANSTTSRIICEKEAWYSLRNAKQSLDVLAHIDGGLSLRLQSIISEIHAMATQFKEIPKRESRLIAFLLNLVNLLIKNLTYL